MSNMILLRRRLFLVSLSVLVLSVVSTGCGGGGNGAEHTLTLMATIDPDPPVADDNTITIHVHDTDGDMVSGATVTVTPWMPMMGHGSPKDVVVTDNGDGTYTATPVHFSMPGMWEVTIEATLDGETGTLVKSYDVQ